MNLKSASILTDPRPCSHIVYPYTDELHVTEAVCLFASSGLRRDEAVVLIMTAEHCDPIQRRLEAEGFDLAALQDSGQLVCEDAQLLLRRFMIDGMPDPVLFKNMVCSIILRAQASAGPEVVRKVRLFGEMVSLLWRVSEAAAERLEHLWNEVIDEYSVALLCTYALQGQSSPTLPQSLMAPHNHSVAAGD